MIGYLPEAYPDETFYSLVCRRSIHLGYDAYAQSASDFLMDKGKFSKQFMGPLNQEASKVLEAAYGMEHVIKEHTMFPEYARFLMPRLQREALQKLSHAKSNQDYMPFAKSVSRCCLNYCPLCAREDLMLYGERYWHRKHQIRNIRTCPKHGCLLASTQISLGCNARTILYPAEDIIEDREPDFSIAPMLLRYDEYISKVFDAPMPMAGDASVGRYISQKLEGTSYQFNSVHKYTTKMYADYVSFWEGYPMVEVSNYTIIDVMRKIFNGRNTSFHDICRLGFFLGIPPETLANPSAQD